jgi:2-dehydro-3-deoxyphosphogluconate aldolase/(4S)-4-hydroxy-2-oxoglutarate aldolase
MARFTRIQVALKMAEEGMIPVFFNSDAGLCKQVIMACYKGGSRLFEFTNRGAFALLIFEQISRWAAVEIPDMILGTGSVIDAPTAMMYVQLDSNFIVSPVLNEEMAFALNRRKILWSPGCGSVSEISRAESLGAEIVKIFPGQQVGGPKFISSVKGPMPWTRIMPTGGVDPSESNLTEWYKAGAICVGMGSQLISSEIIKNKDFSRLEQDVSKTLALIKKLKQLHPQTI